ncbi:MAG: hypothetical protein JEZ11_12925 [Desulfobacterales bacterium]|nr:hypothetical protein [Desulfobacterales bacterium]
MKQTNMLSTSIAYIVFNRPNLTKQTFGVIREQRPSQLFIIADGPRSGHPTDSERCAKVREIVKCVDWPCHVYRNYSEINLGLKSRVSSGLDWVFSQVERAIVLEDDCMAHPDFFNFCDVLLERYATDERVWVVTGNNFQNGRKRGDATYYFSKYNHCWGWASWRRAWQNYHGDLSFWPEWKNSSDWTAKTPNPIERRYWDSIFDRVFADKIDSWANPWTASIWYHGGLTATPNVNLVSNIGFGDNGTHTKSFDSRLSELPVHSIAELTHPIRIEQNILADNYVFDHTFGGRIMRLPWSLLHFQHRLFSFLFRRISHFLSTNVIH